MHRPLFLRIIRAVQQEDDYFTIRCDATGLAGFGPLQKKYVMLCVSLRMGYQPIRSMSTYRLDRLRLGTVLSVSVAQSSLPLANDTSVSLTTTTLLAYLV